MRSSQKHVLNFIPHSGIFGNICDCLHCWSFFFAAFPAQFNQIQRLNNSLRQNIRKNHQENGSSLTNEFNEFKSDLLQLTMDQAFLSNSQQQNLLNIH